MIVGSLGMAFDELLRITLYHIVLVRERLRRGAPTKSDAFQLDSAPCQDLTSITKSIRGRTENWDPSMNYRNFRTWDSISVTR
jgi:hypothetical protein